VARVVAALAVGVGIVFFFLSVAVIHRPLGVGFIFAVGMIVAPAAETDVPQRGTAMSGELC
jgi:hypothetical protein